MRRAVLDQQMLLVLERKRVLDSIWVLTLGFQLLALAAPAWFGGESAELGSLGWSVLACGVLYVLAADLGYRLEDPAALRRTIYATQCGAVLCLSYLWALSGGVANPLGLVFFAPPLLASGLVGAGRLPWWSAGLAFLGIWTATLYTRDPAPDQDQAAQGLLAGFAAAALALAAISSALSELLMRFYQRLRAQSHPAEEARGMFEAVMAAAADPSLVVYADTLQVAHASDSFCRRLMLQRRDVLGRSLHNVLHFEDRPRLEAGLAGEAGEIPFQALRIGPERIVVNLRFFRAVAAGTRYWHLAFHELTELEHLRSTFDAVDDPILLVGAGAELLFANAAAEALFGELYLGKPMAELLRSHRLVPRTGLPGAGSRGRVSIAGAPYHLEVRCPERPGAAPPSSLFWLEPFAPEEARSDRESRDATTGVYNRRTFEDELRRAVAESSETAPLALSLWRLDSLKEIAAEHGDGFGEALLAGFARVLADEHRLGDCLCRIDEDRFALILSGLSLQRAEAVVHRMLSALDRRPLELPGLSLRPEVSVGVAACLPGESAAALVARADAALFLAVEGGGGVFCLREPEDADGP